MGARCACGRPAVTVTSPRLPDGSPFPTLFYLSLPAVPRVSDLTALEADGKMAEYNEALAEDPELAEAHARAHRSYVERRSCLGMCPRFPVFPLGACPNRVKCLHALAGYALAVGSGVCPIGDMALDAVGWDGRTYAIVMTNSKEKLT